MPSLFIDGEWTSSASGATQDVVNPSDATVVGQVDIADDGDVRRAIQAARRAFDETDWPRRAAAERVALLNRIADLLERDRDAIARAETLNTGKALRETCWDVDDVVKVFRYYAELAGESSERPVPTPGRDAVAKVVYDPIGVCGLIGPWNYPLLQISWKVAPALAAGDTMIVKPASLTPLTTIHLTKLIEEAGVPKGVVNLVLGPGGRVGEALAASPDVDMVSLTGGIDAGRAILRAATGNIKRVALEMGGKSPNIVFSDADFDAAVDNALTGAFVHSGQSCSAGSRVLVHDDIYDRFVAELGRRADRIRLGHGLDPATETGAMISADHRAKVERYIAGALAEGARLVAGGRRPSEPELQAGFYIRPTVFADCTPDMTIVREEVFGPVVTVERFSTEDEAIRLGNDTTYGLAGAVWSRDLERARRVASRLRHGTIWINDYNVYLPQAEWGGFRQSGQGRELGPTGLDEYREAKHVWENTTPAVSNWFES
ncbi:MAG TPA: aldehyde dehydrogenase family protein [Candidatus Limnocylindrales bacterium]|nr:aldehyde dehydrogenase family protein [Candidatus Limnocylindrales bacterium]